MNHSNQKLIYAEMNSHSCYIFNNDVIINWDDGSVAVPIPWFIEMVRHLLNSPGFIGVKGNVLRI